MHQFVDPDLKRVQTTWDDVAVPDRLRELAEETWQALSKLADPGGDTPDVHALLDELREATSRSTTRPRRVAQSSVIAARREGRQQALEERPAGRRPRSQAAARAAPGSAGAPAAT